MEYLVSQQTVLDQISFFNMSDLFSLDKPEANISFVDLVIVLENSQLNHFNS